MSKKRSDHTIARSIGAARVSAPHDDSRPADPIAREALKALVRALARADAIEEYRRNVEGGGRQ